MVGFSIGKKTFAFFLLDMYCVGLKDVVYNFNLDEVKYKDFTNKILETEPYTSVDIVEAHNLIYGIIDGVEEIGCKPHKDFQ